MILPADKAFGSLLGLCLADSLGARFEGIEREQIQTRFSNATAACEYATQRVPQHSGREVTRTLSEL